MPLGTLLRDRNLGRGVPITMALVLRVVGMLQKRRDLDPRVRIGLQIIEQSAADVLTLTLGGALAGSTSTATTRRRIERLAWLSGTSWEVVVQGRKGTAHRPLVPEDVSVRGEAIVTRQLGDALLHLRREASRVSRTLTETLLQVQTVLFLEKAAEAYANVGEDLQQRVLQDAVVGVVQYLGRPPSEGDLLRLFAAFGSRGRRGVQLWEPMARLLSPLSPELNPDTLRTNVKRWRPTLGRRARSS